MRDWLPDLVAVAGYRVEAALSGRRINHPASENKMEAIATESPALLTIKQTAVMLSLSPRKVWELTSTGEMPVVRAGRAVRVHRRDLEAWIEANKSR